MSTQLASDTELQAIANNIVEARARQHPYDVAFAAKAVTARAANRFDRGGGVILADVKPWFADAFTNALSEHSELPRDVPWHYREAMLRHHMRIAQV